MLRRRRGGGGWRTADGGRHGGRGDNGHGERYDAAGFSGGDGSRARHASSAPRAAIAYGGRASAPAPTATTSADVSPPNAARGGGTAALGQREYLREATRGLRAATAKYEAAVERRKLRERLRSSAVAQQAAEEFFQIGTSERERHHSPLALRARRVGSAAAPAGSPHASPPRTSPSRIPVLRSGHTTN